MGDGMNKYRAKRTTVDGISFHSKGEAKRYQELLLLERAKEIRGLKRQVKFPLSVEGQLVCTYVADFTYFDIRNRIGVVEDFKGVRTAEYKLKARLFEILHGRPILETGSRLSAQGTR